jgi:hypothetical protein
MAATKKWSDLSTRTRGLIIAVAVGEGALKIAALIDIKRRPASQIRGPKWLWVPVVMLVNSLGGAPLAYFKFGRRPEPKPGLTEPGLTEPGPAEPGLAEPDPTDPPPD